MTASKYTFAGRGTGCIRVTSEVLAGPGLVGSSNSRGSGRPRSHLIKPIVSRGRGRRFLPGAHVCHSRDPLDRSFRLLGVPRVAHQGQEDPLGVLEGGRPPVWTHALGHTVHAPEVHPGREGHPPAFFAFFGARRRDLPRPEQRIGVAEEPAME